MKLSYTFKKRHIVYPVIVVAALYYFIATHPFGTYQAYPDTLSPQNEGKYTYDIPLDPKSPWPKFRANSLQNGRSAVKPTYRKTLRPWVFKTGKGIFSSPVVDAHGTVYIGSADHYFYAIKQDGSLKWKIKTGEIIDSSALLDDRGFVYVGSGDSYVYCINRETGFIVWKSKAHSVQEVWEQFTIKTYNVNWFEGNIGMLPDGSIIAPNDNYLVYQIDRQNGKRITQFPANEMIWSLPAVNTKTGKMFFGTQFMALKNVYCYNYRTQKAEWTNGGFGSNAASPLLTNCNVKGMVIVGGYDGYVRAYAQDSGKQLWKQGLRDHIYASPSQTSHGLIIQPCADGTIYALNPENGKIVWAYDTLEPIRSSAAIDGNDIIYVGSGEGKLFCLNPDGTLRWSYLCIDEDRNDLNSSPALGPNGVYIGGENGSVFFIPYDYPLHNAYKDKNCYFGKGEALPNDGAFLVYTSSFGKLLPQPPANIDANQPLAFTLFVRKNGDTLKSSIDRDSLSVSITGNPKHRIDVSANKQFFVITPQETWVGQDGGTITITIKGQYITGMHRFGLKFFGGSKAGTFHVSYSFAIAPYKGVLPYTYPQITGKPQTVFECKRLAAPNPTMLPSWNQIGFDSLHYVGGVVSKASGGLVVWFIGGKLQDGKTVVDPTLEARYPLYLRSDGKCVTLYNYDGFKINFIGSWDMPFGMYRLSTTANPLTGTIEHSPALVAIALGDEIEFYGRFLKLMGMTEFDTGHMAVFGGLTMSLHGSGVATTPQGAGTISFKAGKTFIKALLKDSRLKKDEHVYSIMVVDAETGNPLPLYYTKRTKVKDINNTVQEISIEFDKGQVKGKVKAYCIVDTYPIAVQLLRIPSE
ncbi:MAG TPA: PQQ-binding-like beta-propeller repeat protein [Spirochaetota bacterium]|nr:PQQ-binding-like beta-propeller repeat protein [Spirochaetota bacterium]HOM08620.1 PQQ-binding-like beta-propeller repeat protein [Spirochaetota bacterium]HPP48439.1 PQQ-binding-like beta-propeller repeat protein [Spirochaetota bacterium]